jgi:2-haloacid dehalogenase
MSSRITEERKQPAAVIFDLGGVVVDWNPRHLYRKLFDDAEEMERFLEEIDFHAWNLEQDRGRPYREGVRILSERFPHRADLIAAYHERWEESVPGAIEGTLRIVEELRARRVPLHALTNWSAEKFDIAARRFDFSGWFEEIVVSGREGVCKPEPEIYQLLLRRTRLRAKDCLFIDDSPVNVMGAAELGFRTLLFTRPERLRADLERLGILPAVGTDPKVTV